MEYSLLSILGASFLGGVILNVMPCVFPMLAIKVFSLLKKYDKSPLHIRLSGVAYTMGIIAAFWFFAVIIIFLKSSGESIGWGFQLQSPIFTAFLAVLFLVIGFNFLGLFEFKVSTRLIPQRLVNNEGLLGEFVAGVLVAVVASPCSAPFMATALGYAFTQPAQINLLIFTFLGIGVGAPFLVLTIFPSLVRFLPKPGSWMQIMKEFFAFPMFVTVLWMLWVFVKQTSIENLMFLLLALTFVAMGVWVLRLSITKRSKLIWMAITTLLIFTALKESLVVSHEPTEYKVQKDTILEESSSGSLKQFKSTSHVGLQWYDYSDELMQYLALKQRVVFVDFTAEWCISCKVNERNVFSAASVHKFILENKIVLVRADLTNAEPHLMDVLSSYGRSGVPLYLLFDKAKYKKKPLILPQILTIAIFINAFKNVSM